MDPGAVLLGAARRRRTSSSRRWVYEQYDSTRPGEHGRRPGSRRGGAPDQGDVEGPRRLDRRRPRASGAIDPWLGAALSVAEATRNVSITGARPLGVTNCLNYGDPTRPEAFWQLERGCPRAGDACRALDLPVTGGQRLALQRVTGRADRPDARDRRRRPARRRGDVLVGPAFVAADDVVILVGAAAPGCSGSAYAELAGGATEDGRPRSTWPVRPRSSGSSARRSPGAGRARPRT